ncbi:hypothetical protein AT705_23800 [Pseudoalteromonas rubra]|uniref:Uncharacterized protein n=1 Tax=Pseudoalteromonas rubra TaxID=43658 RepID=A0A0U3H042_9GAMM|nr:hypothetical protein AT705_23800 [Pseudoalteromonas rubra]
MLKKGWQSKRPTHFVGLLFKAARHTAKQMTLPLILAFGLWSLQRFRSVGAQGKQPAQFRQFA